MRDLVATYEDSQASYKNGTFSVGSFLKNHDQPRFQNSVHDTAVSRFSDSSFVDRHADAIYWIGQLIENAIAFPFVQDGIPILYYGQYSRCMRVMASLMSV